MRCPTTQLLTVDVVARQPHTTGLGGPVPLPCFNVLGPGGMRVATAVGRTPPFVRGAVDLVISIKPIVAGWSPVPEQKIAAVVNVA